MLRQRVLSTFWNAAPPVVRSHWAPIRPGVLGGKVLPKVTWDKGAPIHWILAWLAKGPHPVSIYIGDDGGDEPF